MEKHRKKNYSSFASPLKFLGRISIGGNSSQKSLLKNSAKKSASSEKKETQGRFKNMFSGFSKPKDEVSYIKLD